jgi:hypothetical protein
MKASLTLAQLRKFLVKAEARLAKLAKRRHGILAALAGLEAEMREIQGGGRGPKPKGPGRRGGKAKAAGKPGRKPGRRGRPPKAAVEGEPPKRRGRPPKAAVAEGGAPAVAPKKPRKARAKKEKGPSLRDYLVQALKDAGRAMTVEELTTAVEKAGYSSKNTPQLIRMSIPRGPFKKTEDGRIGSKED